MEIVPNSTAESELVEAVESAELEELTPRNAEKLVSLAYNITRDSRAGGTGICANLLMNQQGGGWLGVTKDNPLLYFGFVHRGRSLLETEDIRIFFHPFQYSFTLSVERLEMGVYEDSEKRERGVRFARSDGRILTPQYDAQELMIVPDREATEAYQKRAKPPALSELQPERHLADSENSGFIE